MALRNLSPHRQAGDWTPTITDVDNVDASVLLNAFYAVSGNLVQCWVAMTIDMTAAAAFTVRVSLPFGIDVAAAGDIVGLASPLIPNGGGAVVGDPTNNEAEITSFNSTLGVETVLASFAYKIQ